MFTHATNTSKLTGAKVEGMFIGNSPLQDLQRRQNDVGNNLFDFVPSVEGDGEEMERLFEVSHSPVVSLALSLLVSLVALPS